MLNDVGKLIDRLKSRYDDDVVDRMNYLYTSWMLIVASLLVLAKQYVGESIQCWIPKHFAGAWEEYIESYCFIENTYYFPVDVINKTTTEQRKDAEVPYYQWVPFFLIGMMFVFLLPRFVWRSLNWRSGLKITGIVEAARITETDKKAKTKVLKEGVDDGSERKEYGQITQNLASMILYNVEKGRAKKKLPLGYLRQRSETSYITNCYILYKAMNLGNSLLQLYLLNLFLGPEYTFWGFGVLNDLLLGKHWQTSGHFPRITFCDVTQNRLFHGVTHTVQCVLMLNLFNEKIFIVLWFWLAILSLFNFINLVYWVLISYVPQFEIEFVKHLLRFTDPDCLKIPEDLPDESYFEFVHKFLRKDGVTVLRLICDNAGSPQAAAITRCLWDRSKDENFKTENGRLMASSRKMNHANPAYDETRY
ncbi:hypothetical protein QR680_008968 [Steinernema hermaphroditum]|uniref:Innexin n=1 Tax=Steinernema hermaphroditum TaxID=289476 RepID=A0AA39IIJ8_9BILA|nr:hypothetical protein QR680_008968 [Steinernema hermaphroditum]